jgi:hypothetical protein
MTIGTATVARTNVRTSGPRCASQGRSARLRTVRVEKIASQIVSVRPAHPRGGQRKHGAAVQPPKPSVRTCVPAARCSTVAASSPSPKSSPSRIAPSVDAVSSSASAAANTADAVDPWLDSVSNPASSSSGRAAQTAATPTRTRCPAGTGPARPGAATRSVLGRPRRLQRRGFLRHSTAALTLTALPGLGVTVDGGRPAAQPAQRGRDGWRVPACSRCSTRTRMARCEASASPSSGATCRRDPPDFWSISLAIR